jgi:hypothetical protein
MPMTADIIKDPEATKKVLPTTILEQPENAMEVARPVDVSCFR